MADPDPKDVAGLTQRKPGYLAAIDNVPPLIFRFQINPQIFNEKRSYKYDSVNQFGPWVPKSAGAFGMDLLGAAAALAVPGGQFFQGMNDAKNFSARLVNTRPLQAKEGEPRTFAIDFNLDARLADVLDEGDHYGGSIEPDLAILRAFVNPSVDLISFGKWLFSGFSAKKLPDFTPPLCSLFYADLSVTCVMTDLGIKITDFKPDSTPLRAEVSVTLKEQTAAIAPMVEFVTRNIDIVRSYKRKNFGKDVMNVTPILNLFT